jgi:hypothetical protein
VRLTRLVEPSARSGGGARWVRRWGAAGAAAGGAPSSTSFPWQPGAAILAPVGSPTFFPIAPGSREGGSSAAAAWREGGRGLDGGGLAGGRGLLGGGLVGGRARPPRQRPGGRAGATSTVVAWQVGAASSAAAWWAGGRCLGGSARGIRFFLHASFASQLLETVYFASPRLLLYAMQNGLCLSHFALHCWTQYEYCSFFLKLPAMTSCFVLSPCSLSLILCFLPRITFSLLPHYPAANRMQIILKDTHPIRLIFHQRIRVI